jgi:hypothetical protein
LIANAAAGMAHCHFSRMRMLCYGRKMRDFERRRRGTFPHFMKEIG